MVYCDSLLVILCQSWPSLLERLGCIKYAFVKPPEMFHAHCLVRLGRSERPLTFREVKGSRDVVTLRFADHNLTLRIGLAEYIRDRLCGALAIRCNISLAI